MRFARCHDADTADRRHRDALLQHRLVLPEVVDHQLRHPEESLAGDVAIEMHLDARLDWIARARSSRAAAGVVYPDAAPLHITWVIRVLRDPRSQRLPVAPVDVHPHILN